MLDRLVVVAEELFWLTVLAADDTCVADVIFVVVLVVIVVLVDLLVASVDFTNGVIGS